MRDTRSLLLWAPTILCASVVIGCNDNAVPPPLRTPVAPQVADAAEEVEESEAAAATGKPATNPPSPETETQGSQGQGADFALLDGGDLRFASSGALTEAHFRKVAMTDEMAELLARQSGLSKLTINTSEMSDGGWNALAQLAALEHLDLRGCQISNEQFKPLVAKMSKLRSLRFNGLSGATTVDDLGLMAVENCPQLKAVALDHLWVGIDGLAPIIQHGRATELYLAGTLVDDDTLKELAKLTTLKKLRVSQTAIGTEGVAALVNLPLEDLDMGECSQLTDDSLIALAECEKLRKLNLFKTVVSDEGVKALKTLTELEWLNVDQTPITDEALVAIGQLPKLKFLHLGSTGVTDAGMEHLTNLQNLENLIVTRTGVTEMGVSVIQQALPNTKVQLKYIEGQ